MLEIGDVRQTKDGWECCEGIFINTYGKSTTPGRSDRPESVYIMVEACTKHIQDLPEAFRKNMLVELEKAKSEIICCFDAKIAEYTK